MTTEKTVAALQLELDQLNTQHARLREDYQKLRSNLNERMPAADRPELACRCAKPMLVKNNSSDQGNSRLCYNCMGWK